MAAAATILFLIKSVHYFRSERQRYFECLFGYLKLMLNRAVLIGVRNFHQSGAVRFNYHRLYSFSRSRHA